MEYRVEFTSAMEPDAKDRRKAMKEATEEYLRVVRARKEVKSVELEVDEMRKVRGAWMTTIEGTAIVDADSVEDAAAIIDSWFPDWDDNAEVTSISRL